MSKRIVLIFLALVFARVSSANPIGVYTNRADWEAAMSLHGSNPLETVGFGGSQWTSSLVLQRGLTSEVSRSTQGVTATSSYSAPGVVDNSTLGHVANGVWTDNISKYGSTTFAFATPIFGFGGDFNIAQSNGLYISSIGAINASFIGMISDQPISNFLISWGDLGGCVVCFGNSYTLNNLEVSILPTPEPHLLYVVGGVLITAFGYRQLRRT